MKNIKKKKTKYNRFGWKENDVVVVYVPKNKIKKVVKK